MDNVFARARDCKCPGTPHSEEGDGVWLLPTLGLEGGLAAEKDITTATAEAVVNGEVKLSAEMTDAETEAASLVIGARLVPKFLVTFLRFGAVGWNLVDESGPVPFSPDALLADYAMSRDAAEKADDLYREAVMSPLERRFAATSPRPRKPSRRGSTASSTSRNGTSTKKPSRSSSPPVSVGSESFTA